MSRSKCNVTDRLHIGFMACSLLLFVILQKFHICRIF